MKYIKLFIVGPVMFVSFVFSMLLALWHLNQGLVAEYPQWAHFLGAFLTGLISYFNLKAVIAIFVEEVIEFRQEQKLKAKARKDAEEIVKIKYGLSNSKVPSTEHDSE